MNFLTLSCKSFFQFSIIVLIVSFLYTSLLCGSGTGGGRLVVVVVVEGVLTAARPPRENVDVAPVVVEGIVVVVVVIGIGADDGVVEGSPNPIVVVATGGCVTDPVVLLATGSPKPNPIDSDDVPLSTFLSAGMPNPTDTSSFFVAAAAG